MIKIKIDKENFKIETDCKTVGEFMTEASAFGLSVKVSIDDCYNYFFDGGQKVKVVDDTPIDKVLFDRTDYLLHARSSFRVFTKPKPKTVRKSGWVNLYKTELGNYCIIGKVYGKENECCSDPTRKEIIINADFITTAKIEWEEVYK